MQLLARAALLFVAGCFFAATAWAQGMEVQTPDGKTAILYSDGTWEYKRPSPLLEATTLSADELVLKPSAYRDQEVVVDGKMVRIFGKYLLQSDKGQNTMGVDIAKIRRADQIALEEALDQAGFTGSINVQVQGTVKLSTVTYYLEAHNVIMLPK
jgi:hypothetical protein